MRFTILPLTFLLTTIFFLSSCNSAFALEENVGIAKIDSSSPIFFLKTIKEEIELKFALTPRTKILRQLEYTTRRLRESKALVGSKNEDLIQASLERYGVSFNQVLTFRPRDEDLTLLINHVIGVHVKEFINMYERLNSAKAKRGIRAAINRLMVGSDVTGAARDLGCNFLLKEASSSALTQSEQVIFLKRGQACFDKVRP